jgi:hypothetical protein
MFVRDLEPERKKERKSALYDWNNLFTVVQNLNI